MKHLLFILSLLITTSLCAQDEKAQSNSVKNVAFKGVTLKDQTLSQFTTKMEQKGFSFKKQIRPNFVEMNGNFLNRQSQLFILSTLKDKLVCKTIVYVGLPTDSWEDLKRDYFYIKKLFTEKYGEPIRDFEYFTDSFYEKDGLEILGVKKDVCRYITFFSPSMSVEICEFCQIRIIYEDSNNMDILSNEEDESALDEI